MICYLVCYAVNFYSQMIPFRAKRGKFERTNETPPNEAILKKTH